MRRTFSVDMRLIAAAALAGIAALIVLGVTAPPERVPVLVAGSPLADGVRLSELDTTSRRVEDPTGLISESAAAELSDHVLSVPLSPGEPILESLLLDPHEENRVDILGLDLEAPAAVQGRLSPGDRVDVYAAGPEVRLIAESVSVVAVERDTGTLGAGDIHILLAVEGDMAGRLIAASGTDSIHLVRRGS